MQKQKTVKNNSLYSICLALLCLGCQDYGKLNVKANLSRSLAEVSGIAFLRSNHRLYAIADHGNPNRIFALDSTGTITQEIVVQNATNEDWEDLATDNNDRLFIGDFGSNDNDRRERVIYTLDNIAYAKKILDTVYAKKTLFTLSDQKAFPPGLDERNFDIESLIYKDGFFYLFSRNRIRKNFNGTVKVYKLPAKEGTYVAQLVMQHDLCDNKKTCFVTGATLSQDTKTILLLSHEKIFRLTGFSDANFFDGNIEQIDFNYRSQQEGITFKNTTTLYLADERRAHTGGNLYEFKLTD